MKQEILSRHNLPLFAIIFRIHIHKATIWSTHFFLSFGFFAAGSLLFSEKTIAETRSMEAMGVRVEYSDRQAQFCLENPHLQIIRNGQIKFDAALNPEGACRQDEKVFVIEDLDGDREPEVLIDFYSGGAHCCSSSLIFRYNPVQDKYTSINHSWGHGHGARQREDLDGDGLPEIIHYDSRFAYQFSSFAGSGLPIQIWQYRQGQMVDVTRNYPQQVYSDAYKWWQIYTEARNGPDAGRGILAAYLADKYLLGEMEDGWNRVEQAYQESDRQSFFIQLRQFLQEMGYASRQGAVSAPSAVADARVKQLSDRKYEYIVDPNRRLFQMNDRPVSPTRSAQVSLEDCTKSLQDGRNRIEQGRQVSVEIKDLDVSRSYQSYPQNRASGYVFVLYGADANSVMNSPQFMTSISTDIIKNCSSISLIEFVKAHTDFIRIFGFFENNRVEEFACQQFNWRPGRQRPPLAWGEQVCL